MLADSFSRSELRYRRLFESARDGILIVDPKTRRILDANPFLVEFLGYTHEEFVGKELYEIGLLRDEVTSQLAFQELLEVGSIRYDDLPLRTKDGRMVEVEFVSNVYDEGEQQVIQCNIRDVSARKRADALLRESEERFKLVALASSDVIWDWDLVTGTIWWNASFSSVFGHLADGVEPTREEWEQRIHPGDVGRVVESIDQSIGSGAASWTEEYRFRRRDGRYAFVKDSGRILRDPAGNCVRMVGGIRDETEQKKVEEQTFRAQRMESIGTLAGGIAHDLNNVLTPVLMSIELLKLDSADDPDRKDILETIQVSCRRGADLVRQVLSFARGVGRQHVSIPIRQIVRDTNAMIGESFPRNIRIVTRVSDDLWPLTGDPTQIHQVLLNLAVNARDAMPEGGSLIVSATNVAIDPHKVGGSRETSAGRHVLLQVSDTGSGISKENCEHMFEPYFTTKKIGEGTGFGLAIVHTVVKNHGGFLTVESELGRGTTFNVYLPADPTLRSTESLPPYGSEPERGRGELVLVVDDEAAVRHLTKRALESFGYRVVTASNGAEAVALYEARPDEIAIVVTDMMMPVMDGTAAILELKRINPSAKIVAVSGLEIAREMRAKVSDFLPKPYSAPQLIRKIREVMDMSSSAGMGYSV